MGLIQGLYMGYMGRMEKKVETTTESSPQKVFQNFPKQGLPA